MRLGKETIGLLKEGASRVAPEPEKLWQRGGATMENIEIDTGRIESVPFFYDSIIKSYEKNGQSIEIINRGNRVGTKSHYSFEMTTGISRDAVLYLPTADKQEEMQFTIHMDTPWMTAEEGHNDRIARAFMQHTSQPVIMVGPEKLDRFKESCSIVEKIGSTALDTSKISLALAAQDSMQIAAFLAEQEEHVLPRQLIEVGESRAAMMAPAKHPYAANLGFKNVYYDITDPNMAKNALRDWRNIKNVPLFLGGMALDLPPVTLDLLRRGDLMSERGSVPLNPRHLAAAILGTGPAVLSGEAGESPAYLPSGTPVHLVSFKRNPLSHHQAFRKKYQHTEFAGVHLRGAHLSLAYSSVQRHVIERINKYIVEYNRVGGVISKMDMTNVHMIDDQKYLDINESAVDPNSLKKTQLKGR